MGVAELSELSIARGFRAIRAGYEGESGHDCVLLKKSYVLGDSGSHLGSDNDMYVHIRTYTCDVYVQFSEKNMCMCGFVYVQFGSTFQMCMFGIFR